MEINRIKAVNIKTLTVEDGKKVKKISDGGGLYLFVYPTVKQWYFHYRYNGKIRDHYLGTFPRLTAENARKKRDICRELLAQDIDPKIHNNQIKNDNISNTENSFKSVADKWLEIRRKKVSDGTFKTDSRALVKDILPAIGDKPIKTITKDDIQKIINKVEVRTVKGGDTNERVLNRIISIFDYANDLDICENNPARPLRKYLRPSTKKHRPAITHDMAKFGEFLRVLDSFEASLTPSVFYCLKLSVLVVARSGDIRNMKWKDIDLDKAEWRYRVSKVNTEFVTPLSRQAIDILKTMKDLYFGGMDSYVFPSPKEPNRCISDGVFHMFFVRSGYQDEQSQHGLRATMQTQLLELGYPKDWTEIALSHNIAKFGGAYDRASYLEQRRKMSQVWSDYIDEIKRPNADIDSINEKYRYKGKE